jgi:hypothetical protein
MRSYPHRKTAVRQQHRTALLISNIQNKKSFPDIGKHNRTVDVFVKEQYN